MNLVTFNQDGTSRTISFKEMGRLDAERKKKRKAFCDGEHITIRSDCGEYYVPLARCRTAGACLDWVHQISEKAWAWRDPQIMEDFLEVLFESIPTRLWAFK